MLLDEIDLTRVRRVRSLDTAEKVIITLGHNFEDVIEITNKIADDLERNFTLTRREVLGKRSVYDPDSFFVSKEGYYEDRIYVLTNVFVVWRRIANEQARLVATYPKNSVLKHNIKLVSILIEDMLVFLNSLRYGDE